MKESLIEYMPCDQSAYTYLRQHTASFDDLLAISYYGCKITYRELFAKIDEAERALRALGIDRDDVVALSLPGMPEAVYVIYALNKIGAIYCAFDCRSCQNEIQEMLNTFHPKLCIIPSFQLKAFRHVHDCRIIHVSPVYSLGLGGAIWAHTADIFTGRTALQLRHKNVMSWPQFLYLSQEGANKPATKSTENVFGYFYTSGTTYGRKSIILTNENINASVTLAAQKETSIKAGDRMLNIMPLFTCYGMTLATHLPLSVGVHVEFIPLIQPKKLKALLEKKRPTYVITVPAHWEYFIKENFDGCDLSFLKKVTVGGDKIDLGFQKTANAIFARCGSSALLQAGYGLSETTSSGTYPDAETPPGSIGKALPGLHVGIFDPETMAPLPPGEHGEICICGPTVCRGYFREEAMTQALLRVHADGKTWLHSGDIGYVDEAGFFFFCERMKRMYVRFDGTKVSPYAIEQKLLGCPAVARCMVTAIRDTEHSHGMCAKATIVLKEGMTQKNAHHQLDLYIRHNLEQHLIPKEIVFAQKLPYTKNGKLDYFAVQ